MMRIGDLEAKSGITNIEELQWGPAWLLRRGKFEKDFLESCDVQPLLWLRFLDDNYTRGVQKVRGKVLPNL